MKYTILNIKILATVLVLCFVYVQDIKAEHIIGGEVKYECVSRDTVSNTVKFFITFTMYRDSKSGGANFDDNARFGVYRGGNQSWTWLQTILVEKPSSISEVPIETDNPCILVPVNVGVQKGIYTFTITLPISDQNYMISYQRCCRNSTILNLLNPGSTGAAFTTEIDPTAQRSCNTSPNFTNFPPVVICVNRDINFDHSATDMDGDSLVYEFCPSLTAGGMDGVNGGDPNSCTGVTPNPMSCPPPYDDVRFTTPRFTSSQPMGPNITIDRMTGLISGAPNLLGQFIVGVCVKEYRDGIQIGTLRRDFQFNVTTCEVAVTADLKATSKTETEFNVNSCGDFTINFQNLSTDTRFIQNYYWEFDINGTKEVFDTRNVSYTFPGLGTYSAVMILNKDIPGLAECSDTANITINVFPSIDADFSFAYDTCVAGPIAFRDLSVSGAGPVLKWDWQFGEGSSIMQNPSFEYEFPGEKFISLIVEDMNKCRDTSIQQINYFPVPATIVIDPNTFIGCQPANITFTNLSKPIDENYTFDWDFGDGNKGSALSPTNLYTDVGIYTVSLNLTSPIGCKVSKVWKNLIKVVPSPTAGFSFTPEKPNITKNTVQFTDESIDAISYLWNFDSLGISLIANPSFTFQDTGTFRISQIVLHPSGCSDTAFATISILPFINFFVPNAFTPNDDGLNDDFIPKGSFEGIRAYSFTIWNRWGDKVFETNDYEIGWNGQRNNTGDIATPGVYAYLISYVDPLGKEQIVKGYCTLLR